MPRRFGRAVGGRLATLAVYLGVALCVPSASGQTDLLSRRLDTPPDPVPALQRDGPWLRICESAAEEERCRYEQTATLDTGAKVDFALLQSPPGQPPIAFFSAPLGVLLPAGLRVSFDGGAGGAIQFATCNRFGCSATVPLEGQFRTMVAQSNVMTVEFASPGGEAYKVEFSLSRSAAILNAM